MEPIVDGFASQFKGKVEVKKINADTDPSAVTFKIRVVPTYIFLDGSGAVIERQEGGNPEAMLKAFQKAAGQ
jgi:thioredoxin-like negative regulator of GroEL